jgi:hypothetical protein
VKTQETNQLEEKFQRQKKRLSQWNENFLNLSLDKKKQKKSKRKTKFDSA